MSPSHTEAALSLGHPHLAHRIPVVPARARVILSPRVCWDHGPCFTQEETNAKPGKARTAGQVPRCHLGLIRLLGELGGFHCLLSGGQALPKQSRGGARDPLPSTALKRPAPEDVVTP